MVIILLSLAGIPPVAGFFAKYYLFLGTLDSGYTWLVMTAILSSLIGVYYYFKVIIAMYFKPAAETEEVPVELSQKMVIILTTIITLALGVVPGFVAEMFSF